MRRCPAVPSFPPQTPTERNRSEIRLRDSRRALRRGGLWRCSPLSLPQPAAAASHRVDRTASRRPDEDPRDDHRFDNDSLRLPDAHTPQARPPLPIVATFVPIVGAVVLWLVTGSILSLLLAALGPLIAVAAVIDGRRATRRDRRRADAEAARCPRTRVCRGRSPPGHGSVANGGRCIRTPCRCWAETLRSGARPPRGPRRSSSVRARRRARFRSPAVRGIRMLRPCARALVDCGTPPLCFLSPRESRWSALRWWPQPSIVRSCCNSASRTHPAR